MESTLDAALALIDEARAQRTSLKAMAKGAGVPYPWLVRFARRDFDDPGSRKVERVHRYLSAKKIMDGVNAA